MKDVDNLETNEILKEILLTLKRIEQKLDGEISEESVKDSVSETHSLDVMEILSKVSEYDINLIPTIKALLSKGGKANAKDIALETKRSRPRENQHLNKLVDLGYVHKKREGREIVFYFPF